MWNHFLTPTYLRKKEKIILLRFKTQTIVGGWHNQQVETGHTNKLNIPVYRQAQLHILCRMAHNQARMTNK